MVQREIDDILCANNGKNRIDNTSNNNVTNIIGKTYTNSKSASVSARKSNSTSSYNINYQTETPDILPDTENISLLVAAEIANIGTGTGGGSGTGTDPEIIDKMERDDLQTFKMLLL